MLCLKSHLSLIQYNLYFIVLTVGVHVKGGALHVDGGILCMHYKWTFITGRDVEISFSIEPYLSPEQPETFRIAYACIGIEVNLGSILEKKTGILTFGDIEFCIDGSLKERGLFVEIPAETDHQHQRKEDRSHSERQLTKMVG